MEFHRHPLLKKTLARHTRLNQDADSISSNMFDHMGIKILSYRLDTDIAIVVLIACVTE